MLLILQYFSLLVTYFIGRRPGRAGLFAIFSTQSNDFALGNPILQAIYSLSHPDFQSYLYLLAPISLVILNPIGFVFMEIGKQQEQAAGTNLNNSKWVLVKSVIIFNNISAYFVLMSADVLLKMVIVLSEMRIA